jgi:hypothetical protein
MLLHETHHLSFGCVHSLAPCVPKKRFWAQTRESNTRMIATREGRAILRAQIVKENLHPIDEALTDETMKGAGSTLALATND